MPVLGLGFSFEVSAFFSLDFNCGDAYYLMLDSFLELFGPFPNFGSEIARCLPVLAALFLKVLRFSS